MIAIVIVAASVAAKEFSAVPGVQWHGPDDGPNPYPGLLAWADRQTSSLGTGRRAWAIDGTRAHGIGLEVHEAPRLARTGTDPLRAGNVVTVEPGVYLPEHGGVRIEDTMVVTDEGCLVLTNATKELAVL